MTPSPGIAPEGLTPPAEHPMKAMHQTEATPNDDPGPPALSETREGSDLSSHLPENQTLQHSGSTGSSSNQNPARRFAPDCPDCLHVGCRWSDGSDVWLLNMPRTSSSGQTWFQQVFCDHQFNKVSEKKLGICWLREFKAENFPGSTDRERRKARRLHLHGIIVTNTHNATTATNQQPASNDPAQQAAIGTPSQDQDAAAETGTSLQIERN